ncbi:TrkA family potassium uptake protein [Sulfurovum sp.]|uniref:potassium channel family protein n=1 Tax=Sulfurovum sp. TaxID=1969726 RepID=UPI0025F1E4E0|nr:NAD-binding protein [Sulfurovum sp.]
MSGKNICIFGYGNHGKFIARGLREDGFNVTIIESDKNFYKEAKADAFEQIFLIDVTNDDELQKIELQNFEQFVCVMDDEHLNVFLTLSLRSLCKESYILAVSDSLNVTKKLKMSGADKVIDMYEVSANKIYNILDRPIATKLLEGFVVNSNGITFKEMTIPENSFLDGLQIADVDFSSYGILLVGMIDEEMGHSFVFVTAGIDHKLDHGDTIVCIGSKEKLDAFSEEIKKRESKI